MNKEQIRCIQDFLLSLRILNKLYSEKQAEGVSLKSFLIKVEFDNDEPGFMWKSDGAESVKADLNTAISLILGHEIDEYVADFSPLYTLLYQLFGTEVPYTKEYLIAVEGEDMFHPKMGIAASTDFVKALARALPTALTLMKLGDKKEATADLPANVVPFTPPTKH